MAKQNKIINPTKEELIEYEKEMLGINITSIMSDAELKIQYNSYNSIKDHNDCCILQKSFTKML